MLKMHTVTKPGSEAPVMSAQAVSFTTSPKQDSFHVHVYLFPIPPSFLPLLLLSLFCSPRKMICKGWKKTCQQQLSISEY